MKTREQRDSVWMRAPRGALSSALADLQWWIVMRLYRRELRAKQARLLEGKP